MKIEKYKKMGKDKYKIYLDNGNELICYEDVIIKYNLLGKTEIDTDLLNKLNEDNSYYEAYYNAVGYINVRMRSIYEIRVYLNKKEIENKIINKVVKKLKEECYLDDNRLAIAYINTKINTSDFGPNKIMNQLGKLGVDKEIIYEN